MREGGNTTDPSPLPSSPGEPRAHYPWRCPWPFPRRPLARPVGAHLGRRRSLPLPAPLPLGFAFVLARRRLWRHLCVAFLGTGQPQHLCRFCHNMSRDSSAGRASDRRSEGPRFDPGSRHALGKRKRTHVLPHSPRTLEVTSFWTSPLTSRCLGLGRSGQAAQAWGAQLWSSTC